MTLDEFQARLRAACDSHIRNILASGEVLARECEALAAEVGDDAKSTHFNSIALAEIDRMLKAIP